MMKFKSMFSAAILKARARRSFGLALMLLVFAFNFTPSMILTRSLPEAFFIEDSSVFQPIASRGGSVTASFTGDETLGSGRMSVRMLGFIELANVPVFRAERVELIPCGSAVGIAIHSDGVLIVGFGNVKSGSCPAAKAGLRAGDLIISVNGEKVFSAEELQLALNAKPELSVIEYERNGWIGTARVIPYSGTNGAVIGAWVRDSTVGIGTLSFITEDRRRMASLGHAIVDADTGRLIPVRSGEMHRAAIVGVSKGEAGLPGELRGTFSAESELIGSVVLNCELGVFGRCENEEMFKSESAVPCAFPSEVHTGEASILAQIDGGGAEEYSCRIVKASRQGHADDKGLVIEITDERLLGQTGGIVQGMSGSPIIQDGRLAGVVTHVFVNDPLRGYGIYAYWMLEKCNEMD